MLKKHCPKCGGDSYSANDRGLWLCPYCREDISRVIPGPVKDGIDIEMDYEKTRELGANNLLIALQALFPEKEIYKVSTDWQKSSKYIAKAKGVCGDLIVGWKTVTFRKITGHTTHTGASMAKY